MSSAPIVKMPPNGDPTAAAATKNRPRPMIDSSQPRTYNPAAGRPCRVKVDSGATGAGGGGFTDGRRGSGGGGGVQTAWSRGVEDSGGGGFGFIGTPGSV